MKKILFLTLFLTALSTSNETGKKSILVSPIDKPKIEQPILKTEDKEEVEEKKDEDLENIEFKNKDPKDNVLVFNLGSGYFESEILKLAGQWKATGKVNVEGKVIEVEISGEFEYEPEEPKKPKIYNEELERKVYEAKLKAEKERIELEKQTKALEEKLKKMEMAKKLKQNENKEETKKETPKKRVAYVSDYSSGEDGQCSSFFDGSEKKGTIKNGLCEIFYNIPKF